MEDVPLLINVVLSTGSMERVRIFNLLLEFGGTLTTTEIEQSLNVSDKTAKRTMAELKAIELVSVEEVESHHGGSPELQIRLFDQFKWFLSPEFKELKDNSERKNFTPLLANENKIQNYIVLDEIEGGLFSSAGDIQGKLTDKYRDYPPKCYRCDFSPDNKKQYEDHCFQRHSGYSAYPNKASIQSYGLELQGMDWET
jgi:hypothetical protein